MKKAFTLEDEKIVITGALKAEGRSAYKNALAQGLPVTVLRGNNVCRIDPQGSLSIVSKTHQARYKVVKRKYSLE
ncbi:MAG: hypothetical protein IJ430_04230 [Parabacteroides sp.]|nr:hypothetical protein [Parabacteroides sp.]